MATACGGVWCDDAGFMPAVTMHKEEALLGKEEALLGKDEALLGKDEAPPGKTSILATSLKPRRSRQIQPETRRPTPS
jgi:hypothetical protein